MSSQSIRTMQQLALEVFRRLVAPIMIVMTAFGVGVIGYYVIGAGKWTIFDCIYMTSLTMTTVGYGEHLSDLGTAGRTFSILLMWGGFSVTVYATSVVTGFIVEEHLTEYLRMRRRKKMIDKLNNHYILCGVGRVGIHILLELVETERSVVAIDSKQDRVDQLLEQERFSNVPFVIGDAVDEETLKEAGIDRAAGVIACLGDDGANMILTVNSKFLNSSAVVASRCIDYSLGSRFRRAGADYVVSPNFIGGMRMVSEIVRPHATGFLDKMLRDRSSTRVEEVVVGFKSSLDGKKIGESGIQQKTGLNVIAYSSTGAADSYTYNPTGDTVLEAGGVAVVIGDPDQVKSLREMGTA